MADVTIELAGGWERQALAAMAKPLGCTPSQLASAIVSAAISEGIMQATDEDCIRLRAIRGYIEGYTGAASESTGGGDG